MRPLYFSIRSPGWVPSQIRHSLRRGFFVKERSWETAKSYIRKGGGFLTYLKKLQRYFASVKLAVTVLLLLAATSIIGTLIPQNESPAAYLREYGEFVYRMFSLFDLFDMYHSWWFRSLLVILTINVVVCSINRLPATWKIAFPKVRPFKVSRFRDLSQKEEFTANGKPDALKKAYRRIISRGFRYRSLEDTDKGFCIFAENWRWSRLGVHIVHLSVILFLLGGLMGSIFGFDGSVSIAEGESAKGIKLTNTGKPHDLDFEIRCDDFKVSFYDSGAPREYRSSLTILEKGSEVLKKDIIVNAPLRYKGIRIYQSSYGRIQPKELTVSLTSGKTGKTYKKLVLIGQGFDLPEGRGKFLFKGVKRSYDFRGRNLGETFWGLLTPNDGNPINVMLPLHFPKFDRMRKGDLTISVAHYAPRYFTGLLVKKDPGVWVIYAGCVVMIMGLCIVFLLSHQRVCIEVVRSGNKSRVMVAGTADKNRIGMQKKLRRISQDLASIETHDTLGGPRAQNTRVVYE